MNPMNKLDQAGLFSSALHDEKTFFDRFLKDLDSCRSEVIIESPFVTTERMKTFIEVFINLLNRGVKIYIITRDPKEHNNGYDIQSADAVSWCEKVGIQVLLCVGNHHRKLAILDRKILWEGSLNILSQSRSREIMRRIDSREIAIQMFDFLKIGSVL